MHICHSTIFELMKQKLLNIERDFSLNNKLFIYYNWFFWDLFTSLFPFHIITFHILGPKAQGPTGRYEDRLWWGRGAGGMWWGLVSFANFFPQKKEHLYSILQLSVWNTPKERFPGLLQLRKIQELSDVFCAGTCTPFRLEPTSLSLWNLHPFPSGTSVHFTLESASFPSGICISFHPEPASLPSGICFPPLWNLHRSSSGTCIPFRLESASLPSRAPSPCVPPPSPACVLHFLRRFSSRTDNAATKKKKDFSLSHWLKNRASSDPKFASFIGFFVRGLCSCRVFLGRPEAFCESRKGGVQGNKNSELQQ